MGYLPIENYGVIGDLHTVALVGMNGSIDFMSFPYFDSPTVFAAILDENKGGRFQISPTLNNIRYKQIYLPDTNVLISRFLSADGVAEVTDFMPVEIDDPTHELVREVKTVRGEVEFLVNCDPRFDYGRASHRVEQNGSEIIFISQGDDNIALRLRSDIPLQIVNGAAVAKFKLRVGETASFVLELAQAGGVSPTSEPDFIPKAFTSTVKFWRQWIAKSQYQGRWREMVDRSALVLKMLTSQTHGSIVAAPTLGLPEQIGGERNWDYRYTWVRDASFTLYALIRMGFTEEAEAFMKWIEGRCHELNPDGSLQIMYGIDGRKELTEFSLPHLEGYCKSSPVRVGNGAYDQLQLDIYGELMDSVYLYNRYGQPIHHDLWSNLVRLVDWVVENWRQPDEGIWEVRGGRKEFLYSRVMCWVAIDRGIRVAQDRSFPSPLSKWFEARNAIYNEIFSEFWNTERQAFVQYKGSKSMDAANLLMPLVKIISPNDPRWISTMEAIKNDLVDDSLVYRYSPDAASDGLAGEEGTFTMCTFWYSEALARSGDLEGARLIFEKALGYANHVGLYAEELGPSGEHLGNFPQAFTHLGLISAAFNLDLRLSKGPQRG
jgi:GH15 family glucan-1,4-alpha-glucosidase